MTSKNFKQSMVNQDQEIIFEVVKVSGSWVFPAASSIVEATRGKNMYLRLTDDGESGIFRLDYVKDGENAGETVFGFVGNGGMDLVELTATTDVAGVTTGTWEYAPGEGPAGEAIGNLGQPLQWKGPATVSELNTGITGIQPGWTYTLTDSGTLTDGSVAVDVGDEVAWTEDDEWFPLGAENKLKIFEYSYEDGAWQYPSISDVSSVAVAGKVVYLCENSPAGKTYYQLTYRGSGSGNITVEFVNAENGLCIKGYLPNGGRDSWTRESSGTSKNFAPDYSTLTFPIAEGTQCVHLGKYYYANQAIATSEDWTAAHWTQTSVAEQIGNVETLLAAL